MGGQATQRRKKSKLLAPEIMRLIAQGGMSQREVAEKVGCSLATVVRVKSEATRAGTSFIYRRDPPKPRAELSPEVLECLVDTPEGFRRFYDRYNTEYRLPEHCQEFVRAAHGRKQVVVNVPPGHMKSTVFSIWRPIHLVAMNRDIQILLVSKTQALALEFVRSIAGEMESNERLVTELGVFKPFSESGMWSPGTGKIEVEGRNRSLAHGGTIRGLGAGMQVYGFRADLIVADDLIDTETVRSDEKRRQLSEWFNVILRSRLRPKGRIVVVGTRFHPEDIYGELIAKRITRDVDSEPMYAHVNFPALREPGSGPAIPTNDFTNGIPLWPDVWPATDLFTEVYSAIGASEWQQSYQQVPITSTDALAWPEWVYGTDSEATPERRGCLDLTRPSGVGVRGERVRVISVDPSPTKFVGIVLADLTEREEAGKVVTDYTIIEIVRAKMLARELQATLERMCEDHPGVRYLIFEVNSFARWFTQDLDFSSWAKARGIRVIGHTTGRNKTDPELGLEHSLPPLFEFARIRLPYADPRSKEMSQLLIREATQYTPTYHGTTDVLMALWFIVFNRRKLRRPNAVSEVIGWRVPSRLRGGFRQKASA